MSKPTLQKQIDELKTTVNKIVCKIGFDAMDKKEDCGVPQDGKLHDGMDLPSPPEKDITCECGRELDKEQMDKISNITFTCSDCIEKKKESKKGRWRAEERGGKYYTISDAGNIWNLSENGNSCGNYRYKVGNYFQTKEQAQAKLDLINHIAKFEEPEEGEEHWYIPMDEEWATVFSYVTDGWLDRLYWQSGFLLPTSSTKKDRAERLRLLKDIYDN